MAWDYDALLMRWEQIAGGLWCVLVLFSGCASSGSTALKISGTPRALFTVNYESGEMTGAVSSSTGNGAPSAVFEVSGKVVKCEISKADPGADLIAELMQNGERVYRVEVPPGSAGVRIFRDGSRWQHEFF